MGEGVALRDSAGVRIVESETRAWSADSAWTLAVDSPMVDITGTSAVPFEQIVRVLRTPMGLIAVADGGTQRIRVYDAAGRFVRMLGSPGTEPGEFQALSWIGAASDTLVAYDLVQRRVTVFGVRGRLRTVSLDDGSTAFTSPVGIHADGTLLFVSGGPRFPFPAMAGTMVRDSVTLMRLSPDGEQRDTLGVFPWGESFGVPIQSGDQRFVAPMPRPFGRRTSIAVMEDGFVVGRGGQFVVDVHGADGALRLSLRRSVEGAPVTPEAVEGFRMARASAPAAPGLQRQLDSALVAALDSAPFPASMPVFERVLVDDAGFIWVELYSVRGDQPAEWSVHAPDGRWLGDVRVPARLEVHHIGTDAVYGVWRDPGEDPRVRAYRLMKP